MTSLLCLDHHFPAPREGQWMELRLSRPQAALGGGGGQGKAVAQGQLPVGGVYGFFPHTP